MAGLNEKQQLRNCKGIQSYLIENKQETLKKLRRLKKKMKQYLK